MSNETDTDHTALAVAVGDPAGVGPEVSVRAAERCAEHTGAVLFGDATRLERMVSEQRRVQHLDASGPLHPSPGALGLVHVGEWSDASVAAHAPTAEGGSAQLRALDAAADAVRAGRARGLVTGPTSKVAAALSGASFRGQTEHLAEAAGLEDDAVTMMFLGPRLRVALVTTHVAIRQVPSAITRGRVERTIEHLVEALVRLGIPSPRLAITGLNPHAGESGLFGDEEAGVLAPAVEQMRRRLGRKVHLEGPSPAESVFRETSEERFDGVVAMMHDQATIASKLLDWAQAVNVTWGLPFVRTSVDHGVAYDAAARGEAGADGMVAAIRMADRLTRDEAEP